MRLSLVAFAAAVAASLIVPLPAQAGNPATGQTVYDANCAACHGSDGVPIMPEIPSFKNGERLEKPDSELLTTIRNGGNVMPAWVGLISDTEMADALAYIRTLRK